MKNIERQHKNLKKLYDQGQSPLELLKEISCSCIEKACDLEVLNYSQVNGKPYEAYTDGDSISRPIAKRLFVRDVDEFKELWDEFVSSINPATHQSSLSAGDIDRVLYTGIMGFAACYDVWKNKSRKTPGTHFEVLLGSILTKFLPGFTRTKFISLPGQDEKLSTDIVFTKNGCGIVIPAKITTRERIVQPYAHQRILDSIFPGGKYASTLMCVSETQRDDDDTGVNEICVPGTIKLFQAHLAKLAGIYYIDPPARYLKKDITDIVNVGSIGSFLKSGLSRTVLPSIKK